MRELKRRARVLLPDDGFSLTEVMVAIAVMGLLATATIGLYIAGQNSTQSQQHREVAITVANESMEQISIQAVFIDGATGVSSILGGRFQSAVSSAWAANSTMSGMTATYPAWDPTATSASTANVPIIRAVTLQGTKYTATTLIGYCYQPKTGGDCTVLPSQATPPATTPSGFTKLLRVLVSVRWTAGNCSGDTCTYQSATLIDINPDLEWNTHD